MAKTTILTRSISSREATLAKISLAMGGVYVFVLLLLHFLEPQLDPTWRFISEYALGKFGLLMNIVFITCSFSLIFLGVAILSQVRTIIGYIGLVLLAVSSLGILVAGLFNTDPITTEYSKSTFSGYMHITGASLDLTPLAMLLLAFSLGRNQLWRPIRKGLFIAAGVSLLLTVIFMLSMPPDYKFAPGVITGLIGRFLFVSYLIWILIINSHIRNLFKTTIITT